MFIYIARDLLHLEMEYRRYGCQQLTMDDMRVYERVSFLVIVRAHRDMPTSTDENTSGKVCSGRRQEGGLAACKNAVQKNDKTPTRRAEALFWLWLRLTDKAMSSA